MKSGTLLGTLLIFSIGLIGQNTIPWSENYKLKKEDYQGSAPNTGTMQTVMGHFSVSYQLMNFTLISTRNYNKFINCYFQKTASYLDHGDSLTTASLLRYQQLIFDTYELNARLLRQKFSQERKRLFIEGHEKLNQEVYEYHAKIMSDIAKETNHGTILDQIEKWQQWTENELEKLNGYCKTCKVPRKKKSRD